jgi:hypothetical protein
VAASYATTAQLAQRINRGGTWTDTESAVLTQLLADVSRLIDAYTRRYFWQSDAGTVRYFTATGSATLFLDDVTTVTAVGTDEDGDRTYEHTWAATDYDLLPYNAAEVSEPFTRLRVTPRGNYSFPAGVPKGVKVTGTWGWPAVPDMVREIALLESARLWSQGRSPSGVVASPEMGTFIIEPQLHPQAMARLNALKRVMVR